MWDKSPLRLVAPSIIKSSFVVIYELSNQKAEYACQVTTLNEFIDEPVYTVICYLTYDPVSYHI